MNLERLYLATPLMLQNLLVSCKGWSIERTRYNASFRRFLTQYDERSLWSVEDVTAFRNRRLSQFVAHAARTVPHYRELFRRLHLRPDDICTLEDLGQLPVLSKEEVQESPQRFISEAVPKEAQCACHTSGSTGAGLRFVATADAQREQWAVWWRYRQWHGLTRRSLCLYLGGRSVVPLSQRQPPFWRFNRPGRQILFSAYHLGPETAECYLRAMQSSGAAWMHGYPSLVSLVADYALQAGIRLALRWITTGAENLLPQQAATIERAFGVRPIQHYGMAEGVANVSQCPQASLHVDEDFAATEFLAHPAGGFRVLGTNFTNPAFPLLRYDTGDVVRLSGKRCVCGRAGRVVDDVDGRQEDYVLTKRGALLGRLDHIFKDCTNVREAQIRQSQAGRMELWVVKGPRFTAHDEQLLVEETRKRVGDDVDFRVVYVEQLQRTARGKLRFVVSALSSHSSSLPRDAA